MEHDFKDWFTEGPSFFKVDPEESALIIVDMQYAHAHQDYGLGARLKKKNPKVGEYYFNRIKNIVIPNVKKLLQFFRERRLNIIYLTFGPEHSSIKDLYPLGKVEDIKNYKKYGERTFYPKGHFVSNIIEEVKPERDNIIINKLSSGAFATSNIDAVLRNMDIKTLFFTGAATNMCVESTLRGAADRGYNCIIIDDACATFDQDTHDATIRIVSQIYGKSKKTREVTDDFPWKCYELQIKK